MKFIRFLHRWIGLISGLIVMISCLTGVVILIGKLIGSYAPIFKWSQKLHTSLFLSDTGREIIGIATLLLIVEIITGLFIWWQVAKARIKAARLRNRSAFHGIRKSLSWNTPYAPLGLHLAGGVWCTVPLLIMALTGLTWSFGWFGSFVYSIFDPEGNGDLFHSIVFLHTGSFWGNISRILWLVAALIASSLPLTGLLLYLNSKKTSHRK
ncbi:MAG: PepSY domain-containing protein [Bacteroides sp.]|nr:PepSY domain-containing protein [Bacteroides sp.]